MLSEIQQLLVPVLSGRDKFLWESKRLIKCCCSLCSTHAFSRTHSALLRQSRGKAGTHYSSPWTLCRFRLESSVSIRDGFYLVLKRKGGRKVFYLQFYAFQAYVLRMILLRFVRIKKAHTQMKNLRDIKLVNCKIIFSVFSMCLTFQFSPCNK